MQQGIPEKAPASARTRAKTLAPRTPTCAEAACRRDGGSGRPCVCAPRLPRCLDAGHRQRARHPAGQPVLLLLVQGGRARSGVCRRRGRVRGQRAACAAQPDQRIGEGGAAHVPPLGAVGGAARLHAHLFARAPLPAGPGTRTHPRHRAALRTHHPASDRGGIRSGEFHVDLDARMATLALLGLGNSAHFGSAASATRRWSASPPTTSSCWCAPFGPARRRRSDIDGTRAMTRDGFAARPHQRCWRSVRAMSPMALRTAPSTWACTVSKPGRVMRATWRASPTACARLAWRRANAWRSWATCARHGCWPIRVHRRSAPSCTGCTPRRRWTSWPTRWPTAVRRSSSPRTRNTSTRSSRWLTGCRRCAGSLWWTTPR